PDGRSWANATLNAAAPQTKNVMTHMISLVALSAICWRTRIPPFEFPIPASAEYSNALHTRSDDMGAAPRPKHTWPLLGRLSLTAVLSRCILKNPVNRQPLSRDSAQQHAT